MLRADHVVEERHLVVGLTDVPSDSSCLEVCVDGSVDLDQIIVGLEGIDKGGEAELRSLLTIVKLCNVDVT